MRAGRSQSVRPFKRMKAIFLVILAFCATTTLTLTYQAARAAQIQLSLAQSLLRHSDLMPAGVFATKFSVAGICGELLHEKDNLDRPLLNTTAGAVQRFCSLRQMALDETSFEDWLSYVADLFVFFGIVIESLTSLSPTWRGLLHQDASANGPIESMAGLAGVVILLFGIAAETALVYWRTFGGFDVYKITVASPDIADWHLPYVVFALLAMPWLVLLIQAWRIRPRVDTDLFQDWKPV